jgi:hypothetical protein
MLSRLGLLRALPDAPVLEHDARPPRSDPPRSERGDDPPRSGEGSKGGGEGGKGSEGDVPRAGARAPPSSSAPKQARPGRAGTSAAPEGGAALPPPAAASREVARSSSASWHSRRGSAGGSCCGPVWRSQLVRCTFSG